MDRKSKTPLILFDAPPHFSIPESISVTREAIDRGDRGLQTRRGAEALEAARRVACRGEDFTTDDVWRELGWKPEGHDAASFMGSVMRRLSQGGEIEKTGAVRRSARPEQHRKELKVWRQAKKLEAKCP